MWVRDLHLDGLRLDAVHAIFDSAPSTSSPSWPAACTRRARRALVIAESGLNDPKVVRGAASGGWGCDAAWADDVHHALRTLVTDEREGYYAEFGALARPRPRVPRPARPRRALVGVPPAPLRRARRRPARPSASSSSTRTTTRSATARSATGCRRGARRWRRSARCCRPTRPCCSWARSTARRAPFQFFTDHIDEEIAIATREGRRREFAAFAAFAGEEVPDPQDPATFERSKLTRAGDPALRELYARLLRARRLLPRGPVDDVRFDEDARWLRVRRGDVQLVMNFADASRRSPVEARSDRAGHARRRAAARRRRRRAAAAVRRARRRPPR